MARKLPALADVDTLDNSLNGGAIAHGLPADAYVSEDFRRRENETVFANNWVFAGFVHELARPGDAVPVTVAGQPVLLVCDRKKQINAFQNACRHRCLKLVEEPGNVGAVITCPYHAWAYGLDGKLRSAPYFGGRDETLPEGFDAGQHGLLPVRMAIWHDWIFINLSGTASDFDDFAQPLMARLEGIDFSQVRPVATLDFGELRTNWKFLMENFIEPYHVQFVHKTTTDQPLLDHYTFIDGPCLGSAVDLPEDGNGKAAKANSLAVSSRYLTLFPTFVLGVYAPDQLGVHLNVPVGPDRTRQKRVIYTTAGQALSEEELDALKTLWWQVHKEDHAICERLQAGRAADCAKDGGVLSPYWEDSVRRFQELVIAGVQ